MFSQIRTIFAINILVMCLRFRDFRHVDFPKNFIDRKKLKKVENSQRRTAKDLVNYDSLNKEYLDGVVHYKIHNDDKYTKWKRLHEIEQDFRRLLAMEGVTYNYKRDVSWRTWRAVPNSNGKEDIISYKCNSDTINCKNCNGGVWTIEEKPPPCPYEFYSLVNDSVLCGANYTQYKDTKSSCPSQIKFTDLTPTCDNPIETTWRFKRVYNHSEYESATCDGRDYCEIFTTYTISPEHVIFRIINPSNVVIYSRIMKPGNINYVCIHKCGMYKPVTLNKNETSLRSVSPSKKRKREIENNSESEPVTINSKSNMFIHEFLQNEMAHIFKNLPAKRRKDEINRYNTHSVDNELTLFDSSKDTTEENSLEIEMVSASEDFSDEDDDY